MVMMMNTNPKDAVNATAEPSENHDVVLVQAERGPAMPLATAPEPQPVAIPHGCPNLSAALALARDRCKMAAKSSHNSFHKYDYASADEVIATAKAALADSGLAVIPQAHKMSVQMAGNKSFYSVDRTILLTHSSGEYVPITLDWPVIPDNGRPLDKALATALTTSMSYLLRDLLQMPRGDEADMNARNDAEVKPAMKPEPAAAAEWVGLRNELGILIREVAKLRDMEPDQAYARLRDAMLHKFPNLPPTTSKWERTELMAAIDTMKRAKEKPPERQPGQDPPEAANGKPAPNPEEVAWMVARDQALDAMKSAKYPLSEVVRDSQKIFGRNLARGTLVANLSLEDLTKLRQHCEAMVVKRKQVA